MHKATVRVHDLYYNFVHVKDVNFYFNLIKVKLLTKRKGTIYVPKDQDRKI